MRNQNRQAMAWGASMLLIYAVIALIAASSACSGNTPPNLTPEGEIAYHANQVVVALGTVQHTAIELNKLNVCESSAACHPLLSDANTRVVVENVTSALNTLRVAPGGWRLTAETALNEISARLDAAGKQQLAAYIRAARTILNDVASNDAAMVGLLAVAIPPELLLGLFNLFAPIVRDIVKRHRESNDGSDPTDEEVKAEFAANIDRYLAEGAAWKAGHPNA